MERKTYRILGAALLFFLAGLGFFLFDAMVRKGEPERNVALRVGGVPLVRDSVDAYLSRLPPPDGFERFTLEKEGLLKNNFLRFSGSCEDVYFTILVFRVGEDYRRDPARAVVNRAFPCFKGKAFSYDLFLSTLSGLEDGEYYAFVADQGGEGLWYNPKVKSEQ